MILDLQTILTKYNIPIRGVIHIGGFEGEEYDEYKNIGFNHQIWIEGNKTYYDRLKYKFSGDPSCVVYNELIYDVEQNVRFGIANNGASSSILPFKLHSKYYPYIVYDGHVEMKTKRMDNLLYENNINIMNYNGVILDIQGVELNALKSFGDFLNYFDFIMTEINVEELYEGCCLLGDIDLFLENKGFTKIIMKLWDNGSVGWGDAIYIQKKYDKYINDILG